MSKHNFDCSSVTAYAELPTMMLQQQCSTTARTLKVTEQECANAIVQSTYDHTCHSLHPASVYVPSATPMTHQHSSQLAANVATFEQLDEVLVKAFQVTGSPDGCPSHFAIAGLDFTLT